MTWAPFICRAGVTARKRAISPCGLREAPAPVIAAIQRQLREMDPNVPLLRSDSMEDSVNANLKHERMIAYLCGCFGALALTLAAVGLYGVMAYAVAQRTREVGIRMALGARRFDVIGMIVREALVPVLFGVAIGIAGALAASRVVCQLAIRSRTARSAFVYSRRFGDAGRGGTGGSNSRAQSESRRSRDCPQV